MLGTVAWFAQVLRKEYTFFIVLHFCYLGANVTVILGSICIFWMMSHRILCQRRVLPDSAANPGNRVRPAGGGSQGVAGGNFRFAKTNLKVVLSCDLNALYTQIFRLFRRPLLSSPGEKTLL